MGLKPRGLRNRRFHRLRRGRTGAATEGEAPPPPPSEPRPQPDRPEQRAGWEHTAEPVDLPEAPTASEVSAPLSAQIISLLSDPRVESITVESAARALARPRQDIETTLVAMAQAGQITQVQGRFLISPEEKHRLEAMFRSAAHELGEHGVLMRSLPEEALATIDDDVEEPRLPVTAGLLSLFLPGTGQLLNGDVGRASLVFAVWSLAWITHLSPVWTFVCLYAGAEAFFTAKIRSMERKLAREAGAGQIPGRAPPALPPKPSST